jgi:hypothetical protein
LGSACLINGLGLVLVVVAQLSMPAQLRAQAAPGGAPSAPGGAPSATPASTSSNVPLARYVSKGNLVLYVEFAGLDAQAEAWKKSALYRMLNETPLGTMFEEVTTQVLDKALNYFPNHKLSGAELLALGKHAARSGFMLALNANPPGGPDAGTVRGTFVIRGAAATKELRVLSAKLMGWMMGNEKPRPERKDARTLIVVSAAGLPGSAGDNSQNWAWWIEKNDLAMAFPYPAGTDSVVAALDGKAPSAVEHTALKELFKPEAGFQPVCVAVADPASAPDSPAHFVKVLHQAGANWGIERIDLRLGFEGDALATVGRLVVPKPRKGPSTLFDQPTFEKTSLLPLPDTVDSFTELSINPSQVVELLTQLGLSDAIKSELDSFEESIQRSGKVNLRKDLLAHLGPRIAVFLAPGRSAATNDDSLEAALREGLSLTSVMSVMQSLFPKLTLVAEINNYEAFGNALDAAMIEINHELRFQAVEAAQERAKTDTTAGGGRNFGGRAVGGTERPKRRRSVEHTPAPKFTLTPTSTPGQVKSYVLMTPLDSALKLGPTSFRPTVHLEGKYLAIAIAPDVAQSALGAVRRKGWKPSAEVERALGSLPPKLNLLYISDATQTLPSVLAGFPGTLQTMINTSIAVARSGGAQAAPAANPGAGRFSGPQAGAMGGRMRGGRMGFDPGNPAAAVGGPPRGVNPNAAGPGAGGGDGTSGNASDIAITLQVDADKLPKAEDLKAFLFPSTLAVNVSDQDVRFTWRGAFPDIAAPIELAPVLASLPAAKEWLERLKQMQTAAAADESGTGAAAGGAGAAPAQAPAAAAAPPAGESAAPAAAPPGAARRRRGR